MRLSEVLIRLEDLTLELQPKLDSGRRNAFRKVVDLKSKIKQENEIDVTADTNVEKLAFERGLAIEKLDEELYKAERALAACSSLRSLISNMEDTVETCLLYDLMEGGDIDLE